MNIDWAVIITKVPDAIMVLIVVYFALETQKRNNEATNQMRKDWQSFIEDREASWQVYMKLEQESFEKVLGEQRTQMTTAIGRLTEETNCIAKEVTALQAVMSAHDIRSQEREKTRPLVRDKQ